jgi:hypothetical protein
MVGNPHTLFRPPGDQDGYVRPSATYMLTDNWLVEARGNVFFGKDNNTFFGQFEDNSNLALAHTVWNL